MAAFKDHVNEDSIRALARAAGLGDAFVADALADLEALELKARTIQVADALGRHLPGPFAADAPRVAAGVAAADLDMWTAWPAQTWVERHGLEEPDVALAAIATMTAAASGEFAVRPYLERWPELAWAHVERWSRDGDDHHRRRLASEGTRPRLPWGGRLRVADPARHVAVLDRLREDPSEYVRRSVANHLGDLAKDDPELALATAERWAGEGGEHVAAVVRHGLRDVVKKGDPRALALIGADVGARLTATLRPAAAVVEKGGALAFRVSVRNDEARPIQAVVDYAVAYARPSGRPGRKVFKLATLQLAPGETRELERRLSLRDVSIRTHHPGTHRIELLVNGTPHALAEFELVE